jgi:hypothetical protein
MSSNIFGRTKSKLPLGYLADLFLPSLLPPPTTGATGHAGDSKGLSSSERDRVMSLSAQMEFISFFILRPFGHLVDFLKGI